MMPLWTCPNPKCTYDKRIEPRQRCPLCGEEAKAFNFTEFGGILKEKWAFKKPEAKSSQQGEAYGRKKFCPKCGSTNITFPVFYRPSIWMCLDCGYEGALIVEDGKIAEKIQERYQRKKMK